MKRTPADLAIFGGPPEFPEKLHVGGPNIGDRRRLFDRLGRMLDRRWLTNRGQFVQELEARIAARLGVRNCVAMCNGTIALEIAIRALGLEGEVIVPAFTFVATAHALEWQAIRPVFCDIDERTHLIDVSSAEKAITPRTTGIIGVHLWGRPCDVRGLAELAQRHNLKLIYDAAHAFSCRAYGRSIGNFGDAEVLSFHATKFFNTFEGGAVVTNNDELAAKIRLMCNFGFAGFDNVVHVGTNGKMTEASAAMGLTGLESLVRFIAVNRRNYDCYARELRGLRGIRLLAYSVEDAPNFQYVVLEVDEGKAGVSRDRLMEALQAENIVARRYFYPGCHRMEPYRSRGRRVRLPATEAVAARVLSLPTGTSVDRRSIARICRIIRLVLERRSGAA